MRLIVGLGNPGSEYEGTRHNMGFRFIDAIAKDKGISFTKNKFGGLYADEIINGEKIIFLKPQKYINLSGEVIKDFMNFYKIDIDSVLIISDDLDLPCGKMKLRCKGGSGGHNGLKNIELHLKTNGYKRIKIGISNDKKVDTINYVLNRPSKEEDELIDSVIAKAPIVFEDYLSLSFDNLMNKYNK